MLQSKEFNPLICLPVSKDTRQTMPSKIRPNKPPNPIQTHKRLTIELSSNTS